MHVTPALCRYLVSFKCYFEYLTGDLDLSRPVWWNLEQKVNKVYLKPLVNNKQQCILEYSRLFNIQHYLLVLAE